MNLECGDLSPLWIRVRSPHISKGILANRPSLTVGLLTRILEYP
jgi:hypothetical protein